MSEQYEQPTIDAFVIENNVFGKNDLDNLIAYISRDQFGSCGMFKIDLSRCTLVGLHEMQVLLVVLRAIKRRHDIRIWICLPQNSYAIKFLMRWRWIPELKRNQSDYNIYRATVGQKHLLTNI